MGDYKVFWVICGVLLLLHEISGLNSKLDFGDDSKPSIVNSNQRTIPFKYEHGRIDGKKKDDFDNIGVVCTTNCDTKRSDSGTATLETDVVVKVKSSVSTVNSSTKSEEVPDIPVVLGTKGAGGKNDYPGVQRGLQFHPVSRNFQESNVQLTPINIQNAFPTLMPLLPGNLVHNRNGIEFASRTLPTGVVSLPDGYRYRTEGLEIKVPYFEPTYHKHYYGENSPPQYAYYPAKKSFRNPVAFANVVRPVYTFSNQNKRHDETCLCDNHATATWVPSASNQIQKLTQGRKIKFETAIDDKLAPVN